MCASSSSAALAPYSEANFVSSSLSSSVFGLRSKRRASFSNRRRPSSTLRARSSPCSTCLILLRARDVDDERQPVAARLVPRLRHDLDDVAVLQARAQRHHAAVDARADALVADVGVDAVREVDRRRAARQRPHFALRREDVDLLRIEIDLQVLQELLRVADLLLHLEQLAHPLEVALVAVVADAAFLVLPVRGDALLRAPVHLLGADLHLEGKPVLADDRRVQRLVAVRPRHRDEVLDAAGDRRPRLVDDAERRVAVLDRLRDDAQRDEVVDALEVDLLPLQLQVNAVETLDAAVELDDRHLRVFELAADGRASASSMTLSALFRLSSTLARSAS